MIGEPCWTLRVDKESFTRPQLVRVNLKRVHPARRRLADDQRTREVNPKLLPPLEHDYIPIREPLPQRIPDLCPDDSRDEVKP